MDDEWGPWIDHDGKGCPVPVGTKVLIVRRNGSINVIVAGCSEWSVRGAGYVGPHGEQNGDNSNWIWCGHPAEIVRFRIRKPRALQQLRDLVENLPAVKECEGQS